MKKSNISVAIFVVIMASLLILSFASCGKKAGASTSSGTNAPSSTTSAQTSAAGNEQGTVAGISSSAVNENGETDGAESGTVIEIVDEFVETEENVMVEIPIEE